MTKPLPPEAPRTERTREEARAPEVVAQAALVPMVATIPSGKPFFVALTFRIHPGYHLSWKNPGDMGSKIDAAFSAPAGFDVGPVLYPLPERLSLGEAFEAFGYREQTALFVKMTPPARLRRDEPQRIAVRATWTACQRECVRETTEAFVELMPGASRATESVEPWLTALLASVPTDFEVASGAKSEWVSEKRDPTLQLSVPGAPILDFIPSEEPIRKVVDVRVMDDGGRVELVFEEPPGRPPHTVRGLLVAQGAGGRIGYDVSVPWRGFEGTGEASE